MWHGHLCTSNSKPHHVFVVRDHWFLHFLSFPFLFVFLFFHTAHIGSDLPCPFPAVVQVLQVH